MADTTVPILDMTIEKLLHDAATAAPDRVALVDATMGEGGPGSWTYRQLADKAGDLAQNLMSRFLPGERLAIWAPNSARWELVEFGAAMAGLVVVAVNPAYSEAELQYVLEQSQAAGIVAVREYRGADLQATIGNLRASLPQLREVLTLNEDSELWATPQPVTTLPEVGPDDPLMMQYTSGTTGRPKGVVLTHRSLCNNAHLFGRRLALPEGSVWLNSMPMFHLAGSSFGALGSLWNRATHIVTHFEAGHMLDLIETMRPAFVPSVPTMLLAMMEHPSFHARDVSSVEVIMAGATTLSPELVRRVEDEFGCEFVPCCGQTEASGVIAQGYRTDTTADKSGRAGRPLEQVDVKVVSRDDGEIVDCHTVGEICLRGYTTMREYFGMPEATSATFDAEQWLHTGDLGFMDERGYLQVVGRLKDVIIRGGENIYPREIEDVLEEHPQIGEVAVIGIPDDYWGEQVAAVVRIIPDTQPDPLAWKSFVGSRLARAKVPRRWFMVERMPANPSGKIQKFRLGELIESGEAVEVTLPSPASAGKDRT